MAYPAGEGRVEAQEAMKRVEEMRERGLRDEAPATDPWLHRSSKMRCSTCMWFALKVDNARVDGGMTGRCRRHAPTMNGFPVVFRHADWCGDHKVDETKI